MLVLCLATDRRRDRVEGAVEPARGEGLQRLLLRRPRRQPGGRVEPHVRHGDGHVSLHRPACAIADSTGTSNKNHKNNDDDDDDDDDDGMKKSSTRSSSRIQKQHNEQ